MIDISKIIDSVNKKVEDMAKTMPRKILTFMKYDAMVEGFDISKVEAREEKISETEFNIVLDLSQLDNDYQKQLVRDIYFPNGLKRAK